MKRKDITEFKKDTFMIISKVLDTKETLYIYNTWVGKIEKYVYLGTVFKYCSYYSEEIKSSSDDTRGSYDN